LTHILTPTGRDYKTFNIFLNKFMYGFVTMIDNTIVHFDIPAKNPEKLKAFYSKVFNWLIYRCPGPVEYYMIETVPVDEKGAPVRPGVNGGMYKKDQVEQKPVNYILVDNIDESIQRINDLGGTITQPKEQVPGVGWMTQAIDPEGNPFAILQSTR
jgi:predicted enzyme related to lactoylglutathione lyase